MYTYSADDVRSILRTASANDDPRPARDADGTSLEYDFGLRESRLSHLLAAGKLDLAVAYGKPSEAGVQPFAPAERLRRPPNSNV